MYFPSRKYSFCRHFNLLRYSSFLYCYLLKLVFGAMFAVPHLVMAIKASEFYQHMPNAKISLEKSYIFTQQCIIELRYSWLLTTFQCNLVKKIVSKNLKYGVFKTFWSFSVGVYGRGTSKIFNRAEISKTNFFCSKTRK